MFFFRHPKPVIDGRAVAVQVVQQKAGADMNLHILEAPGHKLDQTDKTAPLSIPAGLVSAKE